MTETKAEKFARLQRFRLDKAVFAIGQLENLRTSAYESTPEQRDMTVAALDHATGNLRKAWKLDVAEKPATVQRPPPAAQAIASVALAKKADGGAPIDHEIRWAIDLIARGEYETATARLKLCLTG